MYISIDRACEILDPEHREHYDSVEPVNEACRMAIAALREQQERVHATSSALMSRTVPEAISGLRCCIIGEHEVCKKCPYQYDETAAATCCQVLMEDLLILIERMLGGASMAPPPTEEVKNDVECS